MKMKALPPRSLATFSMMAKAKKREVQTRNSLKPTSSMLITETDIQPSRGISVIRNTSVFPPNASTSTKRKAGIMTLGATVVSGTCAAKPILIPCRPCISGTRFLPASHLWIFNQKQVQGFTALNPGPLASLTTISVSSRPISLTDGINSEAVLRMPER